MLGKDLAWLSGQTGIPVNTLGDYVRGGIKSAENAARIADALGISIDYLLIGRKSANDAAGDDDQVSLPMMAVRLSAGPGAYGGEGYQTDWTFPRDWLRANFGSAAGLQMMPVWGDSQEPDLSDGDWVMVDTKRTELRDGLFAVRLDDTMMIKRVQLQGRALRLVSRNPAYDPIVLEGEEIDARLAVIGRVVWDSHVHR